MTDDDLIEQLRRGFGGIVPPICDKAADRIEQLQRERDAARANRQQYQELFERAEKENERLQQECDSCASMVVSAEEQRDGQARRAERAEAEAQRLKPTAEDRKAAQWLADDFDRIGQTRVSELLRRYVLREE